MTETPVRVLVIDDDEMILSALSKLLARRGYSVETAVRPELALERVRQTAGTAEGFDVVLCDYRMPGMVGSEVLSMVASICPDTARLLITANTDFETVQDAVNRGGIHRVLGKPWKPADLFAAVDEGAKLARLQHENRELDHAVHKQNELLKRMNEHLDHLVSQRTTDLLEGLISALDFRDTETQWHSRRVSLYARRLGEQIGLGGTELIAVSQGSLLHDIGKIGVRDSVLLKPGKLSAEEWEEMKTHVRIGFEILTPIAFLRDASSLVLDHHERFDGTGYPQGTRGQDICIGARIFGVVDTFDAMTSDRPYRKGLSPEQAYAEIRRCSGTQFDPDVAAAFVEAPASVWLDIRHEVSRFADERSSQLKSVAPRERNDDAGPAVGLAVS
ncbi:MAG: HD domain-containing phosphohydrolase [Pseudomonadota bacterium]